MSPYYNKPSSYTAAFARAKMASKGISRLTFFDIFVLFVMALVLFMYIRNQYGEVEYVRSEKDGREYLVLNVADKKFAADRLADLNEHLLKLVRHMRAKYPQDPRISRLYNNFDPDNVSEGGVEHGFTSYSVNKGEKLVMCIRQKEGGFVPMNVVMYVAVHELSHLMTKDVGHSSDFWENFKFLLWEAVEIGLYKRTDYSKKPVEYCGIHITSSVI